MKIEDSDKANTADPHDDRPLVKDLLEQHATSIDEVRQIILADETIGKRLWNKHPGRYDDIWILRYILSHKGDGEHAAKAALRTMKMHETMHMNGEFSDIGRRIKNYGNCVTDKDRSIESLPNYDLINSFMLKDSYLAYAQPDLDRGVLMYADTAHMDTEGIMEGMTDQQCIDHMLYQNEAVYQILDKVTRRTGKLTKLTRCMDFGNISLLRVNYKHAKRDAATGKEIEDYHPQLVAGVLFFNTPGWVSGIWTVVKPLFPKRTVEKFDFLSVKTSRKLYKPLLKQVTEANLSEKFGGKNKEWPPQLK